MNPILPRAAERLILGLACALLPLAHAAAAPEKCAYIPLAKLPLRYSGPSLEITTTGSINGTPAEFLVDTGANETFLTRTGTEARGMKLYDTGDRASGIGGSVPIYAARVDEFVVGPVRTGRSNMSVLKHFGATPSFDAILGAPFLLQADLEVSLATKQLTFFVPENCGNTYLGYWGEGVRDIPLLRHDQDDRNPRFIVYVNGTKLEAMIDTGAFASTIRSAAAKRAGIALDGPGAVRGTDIVGVGHYKASRWIVNLKTFQIGEETVQNAEFGVEDSGMNGAEVILGADFLRSHRVLFAMSQNKLYFSYVGGAPFAQRRTLDPWIEAEANNGNADAQLALANAYTSGKLVPRDEARAASWLEKAVAGGSPRALLSRGEDLVTRRDYAGAVRHLRAALDKLPAERHGAFALYIARVRTGQEALAKSELASIFARSPSDDWPKPLAEFYLGTLSADKLLAQVSDDRNGGKNRRCETLSAMGDWHRAHGQSAQAKALDEQLKANCSENGQTYVNWGD
ncbi:MAG TPA: aspartyl protease family protein [Telluria sp.]